MRKVDQNLSSRIQSVVNLAGYWKDYMPKKPGKRYENGQQRDWDGLITLLNDFSTFAGDYSNVLEKAPVVNQKFFRNNGADRLLKNFDILSRAAEQRRGLITKDSPGYFLAYAEDKLASYCNLWVANQELSSKYVTLKTPVAYFEKIYGISRALYTPEIPLISIPLNEYNDSGRWLALAHEMGHHFYWNSLRSLGDVEGLHDDMYKAMANSLNIPEGESLGPWGLWMEEIFADICGVLLAGPEFIISTQDLAAEKIGRLDDFATNDWEHPSHYLRPWIGYEALCRLPDPHNKYAGFLEKAKVRWESFTADAHGIECICDKDRKKTLGELKSQVGNIVDALLNQPVWPKQKRLLDLIQLSTWDGASSAIDPLPQLPTSKQWPKEGPREEDIPQTIKEIWDYIKVRIPEARTIIPQGVDHEQVKSKQLWNALVSLSLEDENGQHWHQDPHDQPEVHWWAPSDRRHVHNNFGDVIPW